MWDMSDSVCLLMSTGAAFGRLVPASLQCLCHKVVLGVPIVESLPVESSGVLYHGWLVMAEESIRDFGFGTKICEIRSWHSGEKLDPSGNS